MMQEATDEEVIQWAKRRLEVAKQRSPHRKASALMETVEVLIGVLESKLPKPAATRTWKNAWSLFDVRRRK